MSDVSTTTTTDRTAAEREAQGLSPTIDDPAALARIATIVARQDGGGS